MGTAPSKLVSIITPAYNSAACVAETIACVLAQTYADWEWIVVDDASSDRTPQLIQAAADADSRIRLIRLEHNTGRAACGRNIGMAQARGEFFAFLDADDLWEPSKLQVQVDYLRDHADVDGVCTWYDLFGYEPAVRSTLRIMNPNLLVTRRDFLVGLPMQTSTVLFRRACYDKVGPMDEDPRLVIGEDHEFFARLIMNGTLHRIREVLTHYRLSPPHGSLSAIHLLPTGVKSLNVIEIFRERGWITPAEIRFMLSRNYYSQAADNLMIHHAPFRRLLVRSILAGRPPAKALIMFALCFLPAFILRPLLGSLQRLRRQATQASERAG